ncbi:hypothetical protein CDD82_5318 [Ophiocordyceps australis]|uniref:DNA repair protein RAD5 n=1 Tax=Ophiocordyceps australis TaxID=1399860 RepID=A0A2C5Y6J6_9HYPO|nr:hypothetical protein CDD82_5318 [Ophiocordyceps australis]
MENNSLQAPPSKRPRFFKDEPKESLYSEPSSKSCPSREKQALKDEDAPREVLTEIAENGSLPDRSSGMLPEAESPHVKNDESAVAFNQEMFESFVGDKVSRNTLAIIQDHCGNSLERAVNMYFDGTFKTLKRKAPSAVKAQRPSCVDASPQAETQLRHRMPDSRYIGAFGVEGWATRSGTNVIQHGDLVRIERQKIQPPKLPGAKGKLGLAASTGRVVGAAARRVDVIVRFTNQSGTEIGRLAKDAANWVSTLIDQKICTFEGTCVFAPERLRTNDTIFLQLRCFLQPSAFDSRSITLADDRSTRFFEQDETTEEKDLRLRQVALARLLQETNVQPVEANAAANGGREGLLKAAEMEEQKQKTDHKAPANTNAHTAESLGNSSDGEEGQELEQDQLDALYKKAQCFDFDTPEAEPAPTFAMTLRPYQKQSLYWMMAKEKDQRGSREPSLHPLWEEYAWPVKDADEKDLPQVPGQSKFYVNPYSGELALDFPVQEQHCLGGILADEMGLGKTIQMLSLIHTHKSETARQLAPSGGGGISSVKQLPRLVSSSTGVVAAPCTTLVVAPMSLLSQWQSEAEKASKQGSIKIELYYGSEKSSSLQSLCCAANASSAPDLVITSYGIVLSEFGSIAGKNGHRTFHDGLFSLKFFRVILDEGHHIKNRASKTARACYEIGAEHRWVLTGTPIVNRLEDLFSLVRFLGVEPWNNFSYWKTFITVPFESGDFVRALNVVQTVLEPLVMRRTKDMKMANGEALVRLPPKQIDIVNVELSKAEREVYNYIFQRAKRTFSESLEAGTVMKAYTTIFAQILRLRQSCCHPILVRNKELVADEQEAGAAADAAAGLGDDMDLESLVAQFAAETEEAAKESNAFGAHALEEIRSEAGKECPLCFEEPMQHQVVTGCWHSACRKCLVDYMEHESERGVVAKCFNCRARLNRRDVFEVVRHDDEADEADAKPGPISLQRMGVNESSAKVAALIWQLRALRREHRGIKSVVFSQFTSFLSLIEPALERAKMQHLRLDGSMAQRARAAVLQQFSERPGFTVLLISLRAGGVGLNLTSAGRVFMMDPWWSFAVEAQAIDRVHRLGQEDEVRVVRFIVRESVEERMLRVQERKKFM